MTPHKSFSIHKSSLPAILLCGHGSRDPKAVEEFCQLAESLRSCLPERVVRHAFLEFARPVISETLDALAKEGHREIYALPGMLNAAGHAKNDLPGVLNGWAHRHAGESFVRYGRELDIGLKMLRASAERIESALAGKEETIRRDESLLLVVGRGSSDPDANANVAKLTRMLWEGMGFGWGQPAYSGVTFPLVPPALEHAVRLGYRRVVLFPWFLFSGVLIERIYTQMEECAARHRDVEFVKAGYLGTHPLVIETFLERISEIEAGVPAMNCQLCKYREQFVGFEDEVGLRQESHHHHVEGIGTGASNPHSHGHHHPYPGRNHPLGPLGQSQKRAHGQSQKHNEKSFAK